ncbi:MAG TPA: hypothetical protein PKA06_01640 [Gemmatales bacterium]|nr:hypothetical protein [Gemmatales bacterium]HMP16733.1 hypothetical protein [Gemmatales bacterium]
MKRLRSIMMWCAALSVLMATVIAHADGKLNISNWKEILPEPAYAQLVGESIKNLTSFTSSPSQFNQNGKKVQAEATNLIIFAEIAHRAGDSKASGLRKVAVELLAAAKAKKGDEAKSITASLADYKNLTGDNKDADLGKLTSLGTIMNGPVKEVDRNLTQYKRLTSTSLGAKGKAEEVQANMYRMAAMAVATSAHVPTELPDGKTAKDWLDSAEAMRKHALEAATAAKDKKLQELKKAVNDLTASCAKCHDDFRVETN